MPSLNIAELVVKFQDMNFKEHIKTIEHLFGYINIFFWPWLLPISTFHLPEVPNGYSLNMCLLKTLVIILPLNFLSLGK